MLELEGLEQIRLPTHCPQCQTPITYEPVPPGLLRFHMLPGGKLDFACPETKSVL